MRDPAAARLQSPVAVKLDLVDPVPRSHGFDELGLHRFNEVKKVVRSGRLLGTSHWSVSRSRTLAFFRSILGLLGRLL